MKLKEGDYILVKWRDQSYYTGPEIAKNAIQEMIGKTFVIFVSENDNWLCGASEFFISDGQHQYRHVFTWPKECIESIRKLKLI